MKMVSRHYCKKYTMLQIGCWNGTDLLAFIQNAPIVLHGIESLSSTIIHCCDLESELVWYCTAADWCKNLIPDFQSMYKKQR